jgi:hypothetical protein
MRWCLGLGVWGRVLRLYMSAEARFVAVGAFCWCVVECGAVGFRLLGALGLEGGFHVGVEEGAAPFGGAQLGGG